ncbi:endopeptidase La, partial [bacterium]
MADEKLSVPEILPILPLRGVVAFPNLLIPIAVTLDKNIKLVDDVLNKDKLLGIVAQKTDKEVPEKEDIFMVGVFGKIVRMLRFPDQTIRILVQGLARIRIKEILTLDPYILAKVEEIKEEVKKDMELEALAREVLGLFQKLTKLAPYLPEELGVVVMNIEDPVRLADFVSSNVNFSLEDKQKLLETPNVKERLRMLITLINKELTVLELGEKIRERIESKIDKDQSEYILREQLKAIQKELGIEDEQQAEIEELRRKIKEAKMPEDVEKIAMKELERLSRIPPQAAEYTVIHTYLDWLINLPWARETKDRLDIKEAEKILDEDHYNLEDVKKRILEYLAVKKLKKDAKGPILCFVGPPGVGKTSLGRSIARALGRKFIRISLGGVRDEAEIRGHRRTYVGALPGRIIQEIRRAGSRNPVFMLDEVDKIGVDFRGDPASALLEVLDPEQNFSFVDHYLDVPFDLSRVMFITTANIIDTIPPALRDRMEIIKLPGYTLEEKKEIAKRYLVPRQIKENGLSKKYIKFTTAAITKIIGQYTREAGVRNLERNIGAICRRIAVDVAKGKKGLVVIDEKKVEEILGPPRYIEEGKEKKPEVGVATGLAWTPVGGEILFVEATKMKGRKSLTLTGQLGDVMQESAKAAL